jgi:hypothetical protein
MSIFRKKSIEELNRELESAKKERETSAEIRRLKKEILANKLGRATDILKESYHGAQMLGHEVAKAYSPETQARMAASRRYLLGEGGYPVSYARKPRRRRRRRGARRYSR